MRTHWTSLIGFYIAGVPLIIATAIGEGEAADIEQKIQAERARLLVSSVQARNAREGDAIDAQTRRQPVEDGAHALWGQPVE